jgi:hypothetical protein
MLSTIQVNNAIEWIGENPIDNDLLQEIVSENTNTIGQLILKYTTRYNDLYNKKLTSPMTENIFAYIRDVYDKHPNTFSNNNINIDNGIVDDKNKKSVHLPKIIQKIQNENYKLIKKNEKLQKENIELKKLIVTIS